MNSSLILLAIVGVVGLFWLGDIGRHSDRYAVTIESTELWFNPWPGPGDRTDVAGARSRIWSGTAIPPDYGTSGSAGDRRTAF